METTPNDFRSNLGNIKDNAKDAAKSVKQGISKELEGMDLEKRYHAIQDKAREAVGASEDFVKAHPFYTLLGAATVGFVAAMLIRRNN